MTQREEKPRGTGRPDAGTAEHPLKYTGKRTAEEIRSDGGTTREKCSG
jgi:hypothetical protein